MKAIKNIEGKLLEVAFEGKTYVFGKDKTVLVEENVIEHLKETIPLAFDFKVKTTKKSIFKRVKTKTTPALRPMSSPANDMIATKKGEQMMPLGKVDVTPPSGTTDRDGVSWYGEGVEIEGRGSAFK